MALVNVPFGGSIWVDDDLHPLPGSGCDDTWAAANERVRVDVFGLQPRGGG